MTAVTSCGRMRKRGDSMDDGKKASKVMVNTILTDVLVILDIVIMLFGWFWLMLSDDLLMLIVGLMIFGTFYVVGFTAAFFALKKGREYAMQADFAEEIRNNDNIAAIFLAVYNVIAAILFIAKLRAMFAGVGYFIMCIIWETMLFFLPLFIMIKFGLSVGWNIKIKPKEKTMPYSKSQLGKEKINKEDEYERKVKETAARRFNCLWIDKTGVEQDTIYTMFFGENELIISGIGVKYTLLYDKIYDIKLGLFSEKVRLIIAYAEKERIKYAVLHIENRDYNDLRNCILTFVKDGKICRKEMSVELGDKDEPKNLVCEGCGSTEIERIGGVYVCPYCGRRRK